MGQFRVPFKQSQMSWKMPFFLWWPPAPLKCVTPPKKWYHHIAQLSAHLKPPKPRQPPIAPSLRKLWFSEGPVFWQKYSNGPAVAKSWHMSKVTIRCHKRCVKLSWVQIWQKIPMGSVPNCRWQIPRCDAIRWFKCKLKPPKNSVFF